MSDKSVVTTPKLHTVFCGTAQNISLQDENHWSHLESFGKSDFLDDGLQCKVITTHSKIEIIIISLNMYLSEQAPLPV